MRSAAQRRASANGDDLTRARAHTHARTHCTHRAGREWIRTPLLLYAAHVPTSVVPLLGAFFAPGTLLTDAQKTALFGFYIPFIIVPLVLLWRVTATPTVFPSSARLKQH